VRKNRSDNEQAYFRIGELAKKAGVNQRTLRFYEERGLLSPSSRFESGMRLYSDEDVERVHLIRQLQETLGCSLAEIREMVAPEQGHTNGNGAELGRFEADKGIRRQAVEVTRSQLSLISRKLVSLEHLRGQLEEKLVQYLEEQWAESRRTPTVDSRKALDGDLHGMKAGQRGE
jgi:MerR family Zn(II)-responsive transcriptional regulator of zntA